MNIEAAIRGALVTEDLEAATLLRHAACLEMPPSMIDDGGHWLTGTPVELIESLITLPSEIVWVEDHVVDRLYGDTLLGALLLGQKRGNHYIPVEATVFIGVGPHVVPIADIEIRSLMEGSFVIAQHRGVCMLNGGFEKIKKRCLITLKAVALFLSARNGAPAVDVSHTAPDNRAALN